jgi:hypothetical protein
MSVSLEMTQTRYNDLKVALYERIKEKGLVDIGAATPPPVTSPIPHIMHLPRRFALCCLFSFGALGLVRATPPDFGPNVMIFDPSMPTSQIQTAVDAIANQQISNQFGTQRYALLFMPGTYGSADTPP